MAIYEIDNIRTNLFCIGCLGRSGSRSIADFITGYYSDYQNSAHKWRFLYNMRTLEPDEYDVVIKSFGEDKHLSHIIGQEFWPHHEYSTCSYDDYNNTKGTKILVLRDPIERAKSGSRVGYTPLYHGAPVLDKINLDSVDYIIDFNKLQQYVTDTHLGANDPDLTENSEFRKKLAQDKNGIIEKTLKARGIATWDMNQYSYDKDMLIYENAMKTIPELPVDVWKNLVRNYHTVNVPTRMFGKKYRK